MGELAAVKTGVPAPEVPRCDIHALPHAPEFLRESCGSNLCFCAESSSTFGRKNAKLAPELTRAYLKAQVAFRVVVYTEIAKHLDGLYNSLGGSQLWES